MSSCSFRVLWFAGENGRNGVCGCCVPSSEDIEMKMADSDTSKECDGAKTGILQAK